MNDQKHQTCAFLGAKGAPCGEPSQPACPGSPPRCFWHDPQASKTGIDVKERLEQLAASGTSLEGFHLRGANLSNIHLTFGDADRRVNLSYADLSRANLTGAHLFNIELRGANLMKAQLGQANLNCARLEGTNLLGADLEGARLEQVAWGRYLGQEIQAREAARAGHAEQAMDLYGEAEEVYRFLTSVEEGKGHLTQAGQFYRKEKIMRRMQMRRWSRDWLWSKLVDVLCGYGEDVHRIIGFSLSVIFFSALLFLWIGINGPDGVVTWNFEAGWGENIHSFFLCFYYSVVTFTTLGYGDFTPMGWSRAVAASEAFTGAFSMALFIFVFVRKMTR